MRRAFRRYFHISLRTLLVLMAVFAVWLGYVSNQARQQRAIVKRLRELDARFEYDYQREAQRAGKAAAHPPGWAWLRALVGDEYFQDVIGVHANGAKVTDTDL